MDAAQLAFSGIHRQAEALRAGAISSADLVAMYLERIDRFDGKLNAFRIVLRERAEAEAAEADRRIAAGEAAPLLGVPVAVKDEVDIAGELTTHGSAAFDRPAIEDSAHYRRLREAGAVLIGKTNLSELAIWPFTETAAWGRTRNPWDTACSAGGSSGGSAAAVAAGLVGAASASDGGGSIRIPASYTGLFGLKPQRGRISLAPEREHWLGLSVTGCLTRRAIDTALWLDVTAGSEPSDADRPPPFGGSYLEAVSRPPPKLRVASSTSVPRALFPGLVSDPGREGVAEGARVLASLGHVVEERDPDWGWIGVDAVPRYLAGIAEHGRSAPQPERLEPRTRGILRIGNALPAGSVRRARDNEEGHARRINRIFEEFDLVITPVTGTPAPEIGRHAGRGALRTLAAVAREYPNTLQWNYTGQPAASIPLPPAPPGQVPRAFQIIAPPGREDLLLALAGQLEAEIGWPDRIPEEYA
ncbi:MAG TPA: amidase family protein [Solirubrobacterales bacterium]|nr:amidase family protein [Solirubrobacterales bacterium]